MSTRLSANLSLSPKTLTLRVCALIDRMAVDGGYTRHTWALDDPNTSNAIVYLYRRHDYYVNSFQGDCIFFSELVAPTVLLFARSRNLSTTKRDGTCDTYWPKHTLTLMAILDSSPLSCPDHV